MDRAQRRDREILAGAGAGAGGVAPRRLLIVNPNTDARVTGWLAEEVRRAAAGALAIVAVNAASGLAAITTPDEAEQAARAVEREIAGRRDFDVALIGAFGDPGLERSRSRAAIPVVGLGEAALREAGREGRSFGIVTLGAAMRAPIAARARTLGLALAEIRVAPLAIADWVQDRAARRFEIAREIEACAGSVILVAGAPFAGLGRSFAAQTGRVVIDGVEAAAAACVSAAAQW